MKGKGLRVNRGRIHSAQIGGGATSVIMVMITMMMMTWAPPAPPGSSKKLLNDQKLGVQIVIYSFNARIIQVSRLGYGYALDLLIS